jgi:hypothetical protein
MKLKWYRHDSAHFHVLFDPNPNGFDGWDLEGERGDSFIHWDLLLIRQRSFRLSFSLHTVFKKKNILISLKWEKKERDLE